MSPFSTAGFVLFMNLEFFFERNAVGVFKEFKYLVTDGEYQYEPYRGFGHYEMWKAIRETGFADCYYINGDQMVFFKAVDSGKYGHLILSEFRKEMIKE